MQNHNTPVNPKKLRGGWYEETEVICCFALQNSKTFGLGAMKLCKTLRAEKFDAAILIKVWKRDST